MERGKALTEEKNLSGKIGVGAEVKRPKLIVCEIREKESLCSLGGKRFLKSLAVGILVHI